MRTHFPHELEVKRWVEICVAAVLTGEAKGAHSAAISLLYTAASTSDIRQVYPNDGEFLEWLDASVQDNCATALKRFNEAYPDGYTQGRAEG